MKFILRFWFLIGFAISLIFIWNQENEFLRKEQEKKKELGAFEVPLVEHHIRVGEVEAHVKNTQKQVSDLNINNNNNNHINNINMDSPKPSSKVITFYYPWYGNPKVNGKWLHWNHQILVDNGKTYEPPESIGANFYPELGPYSSIDPEVIDIHMKQMLQSGIGVISVSWWGKYGDQQINDQFGSGYTDRATKILLDHAQQHGIKVCLHHEPYDKRTGETFKSDMEYIANTYGDHPALYRYKGKPLIFVYDSYKTPVDLWRAVLHPEGSQTIRGTKADAIVIALMVNDDDKGLILRGGFDGFYTYFATDGFTMGSSTARWPALKDWARENSKIFIPSVGPGYDDTRIRPWNSVNKRDRKNGEYYAAMWTAALNVSPDLISITSWNEWHEGTQIEPSIPKDIPGYSYSNFLPNAPDFYLKKTAEFINKFQP